MDEKTLNNVLTIALDNQKYLIRTVGTLQTEQKAMARTVITQGDSATFFENKTLEMIEGLHNRLRKVEAKVFPKKKSEKESEPKSKD